MNASSIWQLLWQVSWQAAVVAAVIWGISRLSAKSPAAWRHALWVVVMIKLFIPPFAQFPTGLAFWQNLQNKAEQAEVYKVAPFAPRVSTVAVSSSKNPPAVSTTSGKPMSTYPGASYLFPPANGAKNSAAASADINPYQRATLIIWLLGMAGMLNYLIVRCFRQRRLIRHSTPVDAGLKAMLADASKRLGVKRVPKIRFSEAAPTPMLVGLISPTILIPPTIRESCDLKGLKAMLLHEMAHIKRRDMLVLWLQQIAQVVFFFHPAMWLACRELKKERELACDEMVLSYAGIDRSEYAAGYISALKLANAVPAVPASLAMAEPFEIEARRLKMIMRPSIPRLSKGWLAALLVVVAIVIPNFSGVASGVPTASVNAVSDAGFGLEQKVTYEAVHKPLKFIIADLSKVTGVKLNAGVNTQDWQVRDRKMTIHVKDVPLSSLMNSIARVMKFKWSTNSRIDPPSYRLILDREALSAMLVQQAQVDAELHRRTVEGRRRCIEGLVRVADFSDNEAAQLRHENPYLYLCWKTGFAEVTSKMLVELPGLKEKFIAGRNNMNPSVTYLTPETRKLYVEAARNFLSYRSMWYGYELKEGDDLEDISFGDIGMETLPRPFTDWRHTQMYCYGGLGTGTAKDYYMLGAFYDPESEFARTWAEAILKGIEEGRDIKDRDKEAWQKNTDAAIEANDEFETLMMWDPFLSDHPDEAQLHEKVKIALDQREAAREVGQAYCALHGHMLRTVQNEIAQSAGLNIVSDSFGFIEARAYTPPSDETDLKETLDSLADAYYYNWEKHGPIIEFRHRDWFRKRCSQVPDEWLAKWRGILQKKGSFTLDEYAQLSVLSFDQLEENIAPDPTLCCCTSDLWNLANNWALLRLYSSLTPKEKKDLYKPTGVNLYTLGRDRWPLVEELCTYGMGFSWNSEKFLNKEKGLILLVKTQDTEYVGTQYNFYAGTANWSDVRGWHLYIPRYRAPGGSE